MEAEVTDEPVVEIDPVQLARRDHLDHTDHHGSDGLGADRGRSVSHAVDARTRR